MVQDKHFAKDWSPLSVYQAKVDACVSSGGRPLPNKSIGWNKFPWNPAKTTAGNGWGATIPGASTVICSADAGYIKRLSDKTADFFFFFSLFVQVVIERRLTFWDNDFNDTN